MTFPYRCFRFCAAMLALCGLSEASLESAKSALESGLWDVASLRLENFLEEKSLSADQKKDALLLLAESSIRGKNAERAIEILSDPLLKDDPAAEFWNAQALAGKGLYPEAVAQFLQITTKDAHPYREEAALTASSLQLSLAQPAEALETLNLLRGPDGEISSMQARLNMIRILLDQDRLSEARSLFPPSDVVPDKLVATAKFLKATLFLREKKASKAAPLFQDLRESAQGQSLQQFQQATLGYADSLAQQGDYSSATASLLSFIAENPDSSLLAPIFQRIIAWYPDEFVSPDDPTLKSLANWQPQTTPVATGLLNIRTSDAVATIPSSVTTLSDLEVFALYARALALKKVPDEDAQHTAVSLMKRLHLLAPNHFLAARSLLELGKWQIAEEKYEQALATFLIVKDFTTSPAVKGEAAYLAAGIATLIGDRELSKLLYQEAAELLDQPRSRDAQFNGALLQMVVNTDQESTEDTEEPVLDRSIRSDLLLEEALSLKNPAKAKTALDTFLAKNPKHPRAEEVRLAVAVASLDINPPDLSTAKAQLEILAEKKDSPIRRSVDFHLTKLRMLDLAGEEEKVIKLAKEIIAKFPDNQAAAEASLILGKTLYGTGNYNDARLILERLASKEPQTPRAQAALLLAARSAALGATEQSREEALLLFDRTIAANGPLKSMATLEKARLNISLNRLETAIKSLQATYQSVPEDDPARIPTAILLAEAIYAKGDSDPENLGKALPIYEEILENTEANSSRALRIQYLRGLTLEKLPKTEGSSETRIDEALSVYFSVIDRPSDSPPPDWEWFYKSGFRALLLLEKQERWNAAISLAEKIASFGGPRAEDAATRARQLRLKHMIWED